MHQDFLTVAVETGCLSSIENFGYDFSNTTPLYEFVNYNIIGLYDFYFESILTCHIMSSQQNIYSSLICEYVSQAVIKDLSS